MVLPTGQPLFGDETKSRGFAFAIASLPTASLGPAYRDLRNLRSPGQRSLHFTRESPRRRRLILRVIHTQGWQAVVVRSRLRNMRLARTECIAAVIELARQTSAPRLVLELDESVQKYDRRDLFIHTRAQGLDESLRYELLPRHVDPGLWVADAIAWCFARGGEWRHRTAETLIAVRDL